MRFGIVVFPGTWSDTDCYYQVANILGQEADYVWHREESLAGYDCVILPGGFSYGDYLRAGAIARFSPVMAALNKFAADGGLVVGICNGFQILCESGLLPGVLMRNEHLEYRCQWANLRTERTDTPFTRRCQPGQALRVPVSHGEGNYYADAATLDRLETNGQVLFRYCEPSGGRHRRRQPQRLGPQHRRNHQRNRQRAGNDAPPGTQLRGSFGQRGREPDF